ncbi:MAG: hypothetical protein N4A33_03360 [Bacteriovoracaceae bacterium]|jgi:hypothetical protein|nr:hypothetical protein [Bacteriovoracaceae bacterium]
MKSWKFKILFPIVLIVLAVGTKYVLWDLPISSGKRVGNLTKISKKGKLLKTWEGTIDEGSGDKLTSYFSVKSDKLGEELYKYEGRQVIIYYEEYLVGWPRDTKYNVTSWKPKEMEVMSISNTSTDTMTKELGKTLFCSMLGSLYKNKELYDQVKDFIEEDNLYLYKQYDKCNE